MSERSVAAAFYLSNIIKDIYENDPCNIKKNAFLLYINSKSKNVNDGNVRSYLEQIHHTISFMKHDYEEADASGLITYLNNDAVCDIIIALYTTIYTNPL